MLFFDFIKKKSAFIFFAIARSGKSPALKGGDPEENISSKGNGF
jgi:hypothetical protein